MSTSTSSRPIVKYELETIGPREASVYLATRNGNRPVRKRTVLRYAADMIGGKWEFNPADAITFDINGHLSNGQHRMLAIVKTGTEHTFVVCRDAPSASFLVMDDGATRAVYDTTSHSRDDVTTGRLMMRGARSNFVAPSNKMLKAFMDEHVQAIRWANANVRHSPLRLNGSVRAAMARAFEHPEKIDRTELGRFKRIVTHGCDEEGWATPEDSAGIILRQMLIIDDRRKVQGGYLPIAQRLIPRRIYLLTEIAILRFAKKAEIKQLRLPRDFSEQFALSVDDEKYLTP